MAKIETMLFVEYPVIHNYHESKYGGKWSMTLYHRPGFGRMTTKSVKNSRDCDATTTSTSEIGVSLTLEHDSQMEEGVELISRNNDELSPYNNNDGQSPSSFEFASPSRSISENCHSHHRMNEFETGASIVKAIMGAGSFALPWAFSQMGYVAGPLFLVALMFLAVYSLKILVRVARGTTNTTTTSASSSPPPPTLVSYVEVARATFGVSGARLSYAASISASIGVCGSYLVFIAANLQSLLAPSSSTSQISQSTLVLITLPFAIGLSSIRDMKHFAFTSLLGDVSVILGMTVVLVYGFFFHSSTPEPTSSVQENQDTPANNDWIAIGSMSTIPLALGSIGYLFLIHFLVLPIESSMARRESFEKVAMTSFSVCAVLSGTFGIIGYGMFGSSTEQIVLLNVQGSWFVSAVQLLLCIDLLFTYPVVMRPSIVIVEQSLGRLALPCGNMGPHAVACILLGCVAAAASMFVPAFGLLSGLVGGVSQAFLAFCLPPLMLAQQRRFSSSKMGSISGGSSLWNSLPRQDRFVVSFGIALIIWTLLSSVKEVSASKTAT